MSASTWTSAQAHRRAVLSAGNAGERLAGIVPLRVLNGCRAVTESARMTVPPRLSQASIMVTIPLHGNGPVQEPDVTGGSENLPPHQSKDRAVAGGCRHSEQVVPAVRGGALAGQADRKRPGRPVGFPASTARSTGSVRSALPTDSGWRLQGAVLGAAWLPQARGSPRANPVTKRYGLAGNGRGTGVVSTACTQGIASAEAYFRSGRAPRAGDRSYGKEKVYGSIP
jgi:hypothetical protein